MASIPQSLCDVTGMSTIETGEMLRKAINEPCRVTTAIGSIALTCLQIYACDLVGGAIGSIATFASLCELKNIFGPSDKSNHLVQLIENAKADFNTLEIFHKDNKAKIAEIADHVSRIDGNISETSKKLKNVSILNTEMRSELREHNQRLAAEYIKANLIFESIKKSLASSEELLKKVETALTDSIGHATVLKAKAKLIEEQLKKKTGKPALEIENIIQLGTSIMENSRSNLKRIELALQAHESLEKNYNEAMLHLETTEKLQSAFNAKLEKSLSDRTSETDKVNELTTNTKCRILSLKTETRHIKLNHLDQDAVFQLLADDLEEADAAAKFTVKPEEFVIGGGSAAGLGCIGLNALGVVHPGVFLCTAVLGAIGGSFACKESGLLESDPHLYRAHPSLSDQNPFQADFNSSSSGFFGRILFKRGLPSNTVGSIFAKLPNKADRQRIQRDLENAERHAMAKADHAIEIDQKAEMDAKTEIDQKAEKEPDFVYVDRDLALDDFVAICGFDMKAIGSHKLNSTDLIKLRERMLEALEEKDRYELKLNAIQCHKILEGIRTCQLSGPAGTGNKSLLSSEDDLPPSLPSILSDVEMRCQEIFTLPWVIKKTVETTERKE